VGNQEAGDENERRRQKSKVNVIKTTRPDEVI
jgi:hypothetical protein